MTGSEKTLATVWTTSVARLAPEAAACSTGSLFWRPIRSPIRFSTSRSRERRRAPARHPARAGLYAYSLITRATQEDGGAPGFLVHRLVQDFARRAMGEERRSRALREALEWVDAAVRRRSRRRAELAGPRSARAACARGRAQRGRGGDCGADRAAVQSARHVCSTRRRTTPRPSRSMRRALAIDEESYGPDHPNVAIRLNNLAHLLQATNRLAEAEPLMRRALAIDEKSLRPRPSQCGDPAQQSRAAASRHEPPRRGRAADAPRARHRREELRAGSSRCGDPPQQSRAAASSHEPPRRGRAADAPRARDRREELRPGSSLRGEQPQQSRAVASRHEPPRRGRAADAPRARDRRRELRAGPSRGGEQTSTISRSCFRTRTASPRPSR